METIPSDCPPCFICSCSVITGDIKVEPFSDQDDDNQSVIIFLLTTLLEIPHSEVQQHREKLVGQGVLEMFYCESCTKLIYSAKKIYTETFELTLKFREVQKQIVNQILKNSENSQLPSSRLSVSKYQFNGFRYPFVVNEIPVKFALPVPESSERSTQSQEEDLPVDKIKEEPISADENDNSDEDCEIGEDQEDDDNLQHSSSSFSAAEEEDEDDQNESDSDFEPPPPKKAAKKIPIKKTPSTPPSPPKKENRKSSAASSKPPRKKFKPIPPVKQSKFDLLYPDYPKRLRDPTTNKYHCLEPSCSKMYPRKTALERHVIVAHLQDNFYKCEEPLCTKSFADPEKFKDHVSWHAGIARWKCQEMVTTTTGTVPCPEAYYARRKLTRHVQKVHFKDKPFICETCGRKFTCQDYLTTHKHLKHTEKGKATHMKNVTGSTAGINICNYCGKTFKVRVNLETHINLKHEQTVGKFKCQFCEKRFLGKTNLKRHMWAKHQFSLEGYQPPKPPKVADYAYQCDVKGCKKSFMKEATLKKHMEEKHGGGREEGTSNYQFICKLCGKGFHLKCKLDYHMERHENKESKPFSCEICGNRFATLPYLKIHRWNIHKIPMEKARKNK